MNSAGRNSYDGRDAADVYAERSHQYMKKPTVVNWTPEAEIIAYDDKVTRGREYTDTLNCVTFPAMRMGLFLQTFSLAIMILMHHGHGSLNSWTFDFFNIPESIRSTTAFIFSITLLLGAYGLGTLSLLVFQAFVADNGKYSRGFRAGSKMLQTALLLDLLVLGLRLVSFIYAFRFMEDRWWSHLSQTRTDFAIFHVSHMLQGLAFILYGLAMFYMEVYHDEGTYEELGWAIFGLYGFAGIAEILMTLTGFGAFFAYVQVIALAVATFWAFSYESLLHFHMTSLHDRSVNDAVLSNNYETEIPNAQHGIEVSHPHAAYMS